MQRIFFKTTLSFIVLAFSLLPPSPAAAQSGRKPKLILVIIVDQMSAEYLTRFQDLFADDGFKLLMNKGANCINAELPYSSTLTAPGHSVVLSGNLPGTSGIVGNDWYATAPDRSISSVEDSTVTGVGIDSSISAGSVSPVNFNGTSLCDELRITSPDSKTIGIAIKDRGAILPAGKHPTGAYWFESKSGNWITSTYYRASLPGWAAEFNKQRVPDNYLGKEWKKLLPEKDYHRSGKDSARGEGLLMGEKKPIFPHKVFDTGKDAKSTAMYANRYDAILPTPYGDDLTIAFAKSAIEGEDLGDRDATDILSLSFSSPDYCGHTFGPHSHEIEDIILRLDRQLAEFFHYLDKRIGLNNMEIVLTADHAVCPLPEEFASDGAKRLSTGDFLSDAKVHAGQKFSYNEGAENIIRAISNNYVYFDTVKLRSKNISHSDFEQTIIASILNENNVVRCITREEIEASLAMGGSADSIQSRVEKSFDPSRSGNIYILLSPYSFFTGGKTGTTHGSPYEYDRHIPLLFYGSAFKAGNYGGECSSVDIAATLAKILGISPPKKGSGRVITEIISN